MRLRKISKKGILLSAGLRIILAIMSILILIILAVQLTTLFTKKSAREQAIQSLDRMMEEVRLIEDGQKIDAQLFIESPNDWWIIAWPYKEDGRMPKQCKGDYCLCICPIPQFTEGDLPGVTNSLTFCDSIGICQDVGKNVKTIYKSKPHSKTARTIKAIVDFFGGDTNNVPLDISHPLPIRIKLIEDEINVIK